MRAVVQRVRSAFVEVEDRTVGKVSQGLVAFIGAGTGDTEKDADYIANKIAGLRVFEDERGKMAKSVEDVGGGVLAVSQFTLFGDVRKGRRPSFDHALEPDRARELFQRVVEGIRRAGIPVETGRFGAMMRVMVDNDGPVTILVDSRKTF